MKRCAGEAIYLNLNLIIMKKLLLGLLTICLVSFFIYSCTKNQLLDKTDIIKQDVANINNNYNSNLKFTFKDACRVGAADVGYAWAGAWAGGKIGAFVGNPAAGAGIGAIVVGAAGSYGALICCGGKNPNDDAIFFSKVLGYSYTDINTIKYNNIYNEEIGKRHNEILKEMLIKYRNSPNLEELDVSILTENEKNYYLNQKEVVNSTISLLKINGSQIALIKNNLTNTINNTNLLIVMNSFLDKYYYLDDVNIAFQLIKDYENYITSSMNFNQEEKNILLRGFAVARYSTDFWNKVL